MKKNGVKYYVNDYNCEYKGDYIDPEKFLNFCQGVENCCIVFEESTIYFSHQRNSTAIRNILGRKRHKKLYLIFVFHSLSVIPDYIWIFTDFLTLFKTGDKYEKIKNFPDTVKAAFKELSVKKGFNDNITIVVNK